MTEEQSSEEVQRYSGQRRAILLISLLKGETMAAETAWHYRLKVAEVGDWRDLLLLAPAVWSAEVVEQRRKERRRAIRIEFVR